MLARATFRAASAPTLVARRGFQSTRAQMASPFHYPEGPRSNLPFDPLKRGFAFKYWGFMGTGFALPFLLAGESSTAILSPRALQLTTVPLQSGKQRRTSRRRTQLRHGYHHQDLGKHGTCRIRRGRHVVTLDKQHQSHCLSLSLNLPRAFPGER
ncbi:putative cytochrome c subunit [Phaeosphaeria sp. MPI-PUGE-AT-0046c]|nr:putative cytochrome c subunit [Phaeosphaeria sp. MPI-PUGE-AT-0046c]